LLEFAQVPGLEFAKVRRGVWSWGIEIGAPLLAAAPETATKINPKFGTGASPSTATRMLTSFTAGIAISRPVTSLLGTSRDVAGNAKDGAGARLTVYGPGGTDGNSNEPSAPTAA